MPKLATVAEYARLRGCSRQAVEKAARAGRITLIDSPTGRQVDVEAANASWAARTDTNQQQRGSPKDVETTQRLARGGKVEKTPPPQKDLGFGLNLLEEKTRFERLRIERQEIELAMLRGETISRLAVEAAWSVKLIAAAEQFQGIADRVSAVFAAESRAEVIHRKLSDEIRNAMAMLSAAIPVSS